MIIVRNSSNSQINSQEFAAGTSSTASFDTPNEPIEANNFKESYSWTVQSFSDPLLSSIASQTFFICSPKFPILKQQSSKVQLLMFAKNQTTYLSVPQNTFHWGQCCSTASIPSCANQFLIKIDGKNQISVSVTDPLCVKINKK